MRIPVADHCLGREHTYSALDKEILRERLLVYVRFTGLERASEQGNCTGQSVGAQEGPGAHMV